MVSTVSKSTDDRFAEEMENFKPLSQDDDEDDDIMKQMMAADDDDDRSQTSMLIALSPTASPLMILENSNSDLESPRNSAINKNNDALPLEVISSKTMNDATNEQALESTANKDRKAAEPSKENRELSSKVDVSKSQSQFQYSSLERSNSSSSHGGPHPHYQHSRPPHPQHQNQYGPPHSYHYGAQNTSHPYSSYHGHPPRSGPPQGSHGSYPHQDPGAYSAHSNGYGHHRPGYLAPPSMNQNGPPQLIKNSSSCDSNSVNHGYNVDRNKKGTIDGVSEDKNLTEIAPGTHITFTGVGNLPNSYAMRRTNSSASSTCSSSTTNNNTSLDCSVEHPSPGKSRNKLPPTSSPRGRRYHRATVSHGSKGGVLGDSHRRSHSNSSASTLSIGDLSMNSAGSRRRKNTEHHGNQMTEAFPKRRRHRQTDSYSSDVTQDIDSSAIQSSSSGSSFERFDESKSAFFKPKPSHHRRISSASSSIVTATSNKNMNVYGNLSSSPIMSADPDATPVNKNTRDRKQGRKSPRKERSNDRDIFIYQEERNDRRDDEYFSGQQHHFFDRDSPRGSSPRYDGRKSCSSPQKPSHGHHRHTSSLTTRLTVTTSCDDSRSPTPPLMGTEGASNEMGDEHMNKHSRNQCFTPLPLRNKNSTSPTFNQSFDTIAPQLSWSIAGDTDAPNLGDIADWGESDSREPSPNGSVRGATPMSFWDDPAPFGKKKTSGTKDDFTSISFALSSPSTTPVYRDLPVFFGGNNYKEDQENDRNYHGQSQNYRDRKGSHKSYRNDPYSASSNDKYGESEHIHQMFITNGGRDRDRDRDPMNRSSNRKNEVPKHAPRPIRHTSHDPHPGIVSMGSAGSWDSGQYPPPRFPHSNPNPNTNTNGNGNAVDRRDDMGMRDRRDMRHPGPNAGPPHPHHNHNNGLYYPPNSYRQNDGHPHMRMNPGPPPTSMGYGNHNHMRGRGPPPPHHMGGPHPPHPMPMHHHDPHHPHQFGPRWRGGPPHHPHHNHNNQHQHQHQPPPMRPIDMSAVSAHSKRKCVPLKTPIPSKFQGDMEQMKDATVPEFTSLVNFPLHMTAKQSSFADGMRCCVMCGRACPCSASNKNKKLEKQSSTNESNAAAGPGPAPAHLGPNSMSKHNRDGPNGPGNGYAIIPTQNKGLCTVCDVNVWVVTSNGLEIKWCKGCKNFRPWAAFGDKGLATKCVRCRERQREKYAMQKEEKEKAKMKKYEEIKEESEEEMIEKAVEPQPAAVATQ